MSTRAQVIVITNDGDNISHVKLFYHHQNSYLDILGKELIELKNPKSYFTELYDENNYNCENNGYIYEGDYNIANSLSANKDLSDDLLKKIHEDIKYFIEYIYFINVVTKEVRYIALSFDTNSDVYYDKLYKKKVDELWNMAKVIREREPSKPILKDENADKKRIKELTLKNNQLTIENQLVKKEYRNLNLFTSMWFDFFDIGFIIILIILILITL